MLGIIRRAGILMYGYLPSFNRCYFEETCALTNNTAMVRAPMSRIRYGSIHRVCAHVT